MAAPSSVKFSVLKPRAFPFNQNSHLICVLGKLCAPKSKTPLGPTLLNGKFPMEPFFPKPPRSMGQYLIFSKLFAANSSIQSSFNLFKPSQRTKCSLEILIPKPTASYRPMGHHLISKTSIMKQLFYPAPSLELKTPSLEHNISMMHGKYTHASNTDSFAVAATAYSLSPGGLWRQHSLCGIKEELNQYSPG